MIVILFIKLFSEIFWNKWLFEYRRSEPLIGFGVHRRFLDIRICGLDGVTFNQYHNLGHSKLGANNKFIRDFAEIIPSYIRCWNMNHG